MEPTLPSELAEREVDCDTADPGVKWSITPE
jgi:hypothetical protein